MEDKTPEIDEYISSKLYSVPYVNGKGYRIGNYIVYINKDKLPFSSFDQVDNFLINLFDYAEQVKKSRTTTTKEFNKQFFKNYKIPGIKFKPIKYIKKTSEESEEGGPGKKNGGKSKKGKKSTSKKSTSKKSKSSTRKSYTK